MNTLNIKKTELISELSSALKYAGSTNWDVYVNLNGEVDTRHNMYNNTGWFELIDMYSLNDFHDDNYKYYCDEGFDFNGVAEWLINEVPQDEILPVVIEIWDEEKCESETIDIQLV